ncbi:NUDIX domain-containing protein [Candidatus Bathyarchaeota archaeon]|nr:NUDIX domain-containing protein [Candidatus Bathyarchaeota archaeon]
MSSTIVIGLLRREHGGAPRYLMVRESDGRIQFPGGKLKSQETLRNALIREVKEEVGLDVLVDTQPVLVERVYELCKGDYEKRYDEQLLHFFRMKILPSSPFEQLNSNVGIWVGLGNIEDFIEQVPFDNYLIITKWDHLNPGNRFVVPPGFIDSPKAEDRVVIREIVKRP